MKKITIIVFIILIIMTSNMFLIGCEKVEEVDPLEHVYRAYIIEGWNFKNDAPRPNDQHFRTNLNQRPTAFSDEDFEIFKEIRDMLGSEIIISEGNIQLMGENELNLTYTKFLFRNNGIDVDINPDSVLKPDTGLFIEYSRNTIDRPVKHYGNVIKIIYSNMKDCPDDYLELTFHYGRLSYIN